MGKSLAQKKDIVTKVEKRLASAQLMFSLKLEKVTMPEINSLRNSLPAGTNAIVIKNRLLKRASAGTAWSATDSLGKGSNLWVVIDDDIKGSIKAFKDWQKATKKEEGIIGGVVEGQVPAPAHPLRNPRAPPRCRPLHRLHRLAPGAKRRRGTLGAASAAHA